MTFPLKPPADWFDQPEPDHAEPLTVEADGRVHGHLAPWDGCHAGLVNGNGSSCLKPPRTATDYRMFHLGQLELDDGSAIPVGKVMVMPHADLHDSQGNPVSLQAATAHYDKADAVGAFVRARDGKHGIYLSGAIRSDISETQLRDLRANPPSGDWRGLNRNLELIAATAVPIPGYGIPTAMVASADSGEIEAMIFSGFVNEEEEKPVRDRDYIRQKRTISRALNIGECAK